MEWGGLMATKPLDRAELEERRDTLRGRLNDGYQRIEEANAAGADTSEWESFWIGLLREYEAACRALDAISPVATSTVTPWRAGDPMGDGEYAAQLALGGS